MEVNGPGSIQGTSPINPVSPASLVRPAAVVSRTSQTAPVAAHDELEISSLGKILDQLNQSPEVRAERLAQIKSAIEAGEYDTDDEKLKAALEKLFDEIERDANEKQ